jgi:hypothetical protein
MKNKINFNENLLFIWSIIKLIFKEIFCLVFSLATTCVIFIILLTCISYLISVSGIIMCDSYGTIIMCFITIFSFICGYIVDINFEKIFNIKHKSSDK